MKYAYYFETVNNTGFRENSDHKEMIYFRNLKKLKSDLAGRGITKRDALIYLGCILFVQAASWALYYSAGDGSNLWDNINAASFFVLLVLGTLYCRHSNGGGRGKDFPERYVSLAWVFGLRYYIMVVLPAGLAMYVPINISTGLPDETQWFDAVFEIVVRVPFYIMLGMHIRDVALNRVLSEHDILRLEEEYDRDFDLSKYPSILRRYIASSVDLVFILVCVIFFAYMPGVEGVDPCIRIGGGLFMWILYETLLTTMSCTIGQKLTGIRVRKMETEKRLSIIEASLRTLVKLLLGLISFFSIPVTGKKRALHDFAAGSVVIYKGEE